MQTILIAVAPNGARKNKQSHPNIPLTAEEIGLEAKSCMEAGAGMIHLHVRTPLGEHSLDAGYYQQAIEQINQQTNHGLFIQATTEAVGKYSAKEQFEMAHILKPPSVSIAIREIESLGKTVINDNFNQLRSNDVLPQLILYNSVDVEKYLHYLNEKILPGSAYPILLVLGKKHSQGSFELDDIKDSNLNIPASSTMVCAFGAEEYLAGQTAIANNWHTRIGFENNDCLKNGITAKNNAELISQMAKHINSKKKALATYQQAKELMSPIW